MFLPRKVPVLTGALIFGRFPALCVHVRLREPREEEWRGDATGCPRLLHPEGPPVHGARGEPQRGSCGSRAEKWHPNDEASAERTSPPLQEGTEVEADFSRLTAHDLLSKSVDQLVALAREQREGSARDRGRDGGKAASRGVKGEGGESRVKAEPMQGDDDKGDAGARGHPRTHVNLPAAHLTRLRSSNRANGRGHRWRGERLPFGRHRPRRSHFGGVYMRVESDFIASSVRVSSFFCVFQHPGALFRARPA